MNKTEKGYGNGAHDISNPLLWFVKV